MAGTSGYVWGANIVILIGQSVALKILRDHANTTEM